MARYSPDLQVVRFIATRAGDADRGPQVRLGAEDASKGLLTDGELAWVQGPRRQELATVVIDNSIPRGNVVLRDITGVAPSETVRVVKLDLDRSHRSGDIG